MSVSRPHCTYPPTDYSITLAEILDFHQEFNPKQAAFIFSENANAKPTEVTFLELGRAAHRVAHTVRPARKGTERQVVAIIAFSDTLLYHAVTMGIIRAGFIPYPMSPRNTAAATVKLLKDASCHRLLATSQTLGNLVQQIQEHVSSTEPDYELVVDEMPSLVNIFPSLGRERREDPFEEYPDGPKAGLDEVALYLHSSGSTGLPKTIPQTFKSMVHWAGFPPITDTITHKIPLTMGAHALPAFHTLGIIAHILMGFYSMTPVGIYPPVASTPTSIPIVPTAENLIDHVKRTRCNFVIAIPAMLKVWAQDSEAVAMLARMQHVIYSGGSLPTELGNALTKAGVYLIPSYGGTEFGGVTKFFRTDDRKKDWQWFQFSDVISIHWDPQGDGTHELHLLTNERHQLSVENLQGRRGYATSDLWVQHPSKPDLWRIVGRKDDVVVHTSGEKTIPAPMEDVLLCSDYIIGAIVFGSERDQTGVLIELKPEHAIDITDTAALSAVRDKLWLIVEEANKMAPAFSRIYKEMILITSRDKPLPRAGKGTVMRKAALAAYAKEIDDIYTNVAANVQIEDNEVSPPASWDVCDIEDWLYVQIKTMHAEGRSIDPSDDFFQQGMDSLGATILRRRIIGALRSRKSKAAVKLIPQVAIYENPSIKQLAVYVGHLIDDPGRLESFSSRIAQVEAMVEKYSHELDCEMPYTEPVPYHGRDVVLLTGSTGNLGAQLIVSLLENPQVHKLYALNRQSSGTLIYERHKERFMDKGLDVSILKSERLVLLEGEMTEDNLGLGDHIYTELQHSVTKIIHNAWRLDFNLSLSSFEGNIWGTRNLIDLARKADNAKELKFVFTSSVSSAFSWDDTRGAYPEEIIEHARYAIGNGYGESKYVAERILSRSGLQATSMRIGQISGGLPNGAWAITDWVPILIKSSLRLNAFPSALGTVSWLPMDAVAQAVIDVAWCSTSNAGPALNFVHPRPISWNTVLGWVNDAMVEQGIVEKKLPFVTFPAWVTRLEEHARNSSYEEFTSIPAVKLVEFFRYVSERDAGLQQQGLRESEMGGLPAFATCKTQSLSQTIRELHMLNAKDARRWVKYWKSCGYLEA